ADQRGAFHLATPVGVSLSGDADRDLTLTEQRVLLAAVGRMTVDDHLTFKGVVLHRVAAGIIKVSVAAADHTVAENNDAGALAGVAVEKADVNRIQPVFHPVPQGRAKRDAAVPHLMPGNCGVEAW